MADELSVRHFDEMRLVEKDFFIVNRDFADGFRFSVFRVELDYFNSAFNIVKSVSCPEDSAVAKLGRAVRGGNGRMINLSEGNAAIVAYAEKGAEIFFFILFCNRVYVALHEGIVFVVFPLERCRIIKRCYDNSAFAEGADTCVAVVKRSVDNGSGCGVCSAAVITVRNNGFSEGADMLKPEPRSADCDSSVLKQSNGRPGEIAKAAVRILHNGFRLAYEFDFHSALLFNNQAFADSVR